jgi:hypothetical protein
MLAGGVGLYSNRDSNYKHQLLLLVLLLLLLLLLLRLLPESLS